MWNKLKEFFGKNKKKCCVAIICIVAAIFYFFGSDLDQDKAVELLCRIVNCGE